MKVIVGEKITNAVLQECPVKSALTTALHGGDLVVWMKYDSGWAWMYNGKTAVSVLDSMVLINMKPLVLFIPEEGDKK